MIDMIERLFEARETVNKYDVVQMAKLYALGEDGARAIAALPAKRYTKAALTEALAASLIDSVGEATWARSLGALGRAGRLVTCGGTSGPMVETDVRRLFL
jgi:NADPH:quinone reductase-like Zn-dependent oxidoreductase